MTDAVVLGGVGTPFAPRGPFFLLDTMWAGAGGPPNPALLARNAYISMIETARNVADRCGLTREEIDALALRSQRHAKAARDSGRLAEEIMPVPIPATKMTPARTFEHDEFIRDDTTAEALAAQVMGIARRGRCRWRSNVPRRPPSRSRWGRSTRRSAPRRSVCYANRPTARRIHHSRRQARPNGGAVAIGHPFGATGTRYVLTLATELAERNARYGAVDVCIGSGQAVAIVLENPHAS